MGLFPFASWLSKMSTVTVKDWRKFGQLPFRYAAYRPGEKLWIDSNGKKMETRHPVGRTIWPWVFGICNHCRVMKSQDLDIWWALNAFLWKQRPLSNCCYCSDRFQNLPGPAPTYDSHCSRFRPNRFIFSGVIADRVNRFCPVQYLQYTLFDVWSYNNNNNNNNNNNSHSGHYHLHRHHRRQNNNNNNKTAKYIALESRYTFQPIAVETLGPINSSAVSFLSGLGRRIADVSGETREGSFLFQRLSVLIQCSSTSWLLYRWGGRSFQLILYFL